ncbi:MAG: cytosine permease, partial [Actinobacteria bacterium]|nr:cytosine permease [Actinomycetota bacterium]
MDETTPSWGIEPVPERLQVLSGLDSLLLWGNLSVSLLVIVIGALLVPALSLRDALLAILVGAVAGNALLALAAAIGADARVPGMVVLRAPLGRQGSWLPTALNVAQNVGWSTFELIIIATAAGAASNHLFGWKGTWLWTLVFGALSWALGMLGPIGFVRRYLRKFASWALVFSMAYLTYWAISKSHLHAFWAAPGKGGFPSFGQAVDLVIGSTVSWSPLAADYTRFARDRRSAALGAGFGYFVPTIWCIGLGVLIVLARGVGDAQALPAAVAAAGGVAFVALVAITIDESEKAFADIYSTAVSIQNFLPRVSQRLLITIVSVVATALALALNLG